MGVLQDIWKERQSSPAPAGRMPACVTLSGFCRWLGIKAVHCDSKSLDWLTGLKLPAGLTMDGGHIRFPGSELQEHAAGWRVLDAHLDRYFSPKDRFGGRGNTLFLAALAGLVMAYEMRTLRKRGV